MINISYLNIKPQNGIYHLIFKTLFLLVLSVQTFAGTNASGVIFSDTTWTLTNSPYIVTADVQVASGAILTIEPGVIVNYSGAHEILIKGSIIANGTSNNVITFSSSNQGISSGARMLIFKDTDLSTSQLSNIKMEDAAQSIQIGQETEHNQGEKNTGTLTVFHIDITNAEVKTDGYQTTAKLVLSDAIINSTTVIGTYPRSESIEIKNATISNSTIHSDSYNKGIKIENTTVNNSNILIGCCGANIKIAGSTLQNSKIYEGGGSPVNGPLEVTNSHLTNTSINLPAAKVSISNSTINYDSDLAIKLGNGIIVHSDIIGDGSGVGLEITGRAGYNIGGSVTISDSIIMNNAIGIKVIGANNITLENNSIVNNTNYNIENLSTNDITATNNYWGTTDTSQIEAKIYHYNDDINYGVVNYTSYKNAPPRPIPAIEKHQLTINKNGTGTGNVTGQGINCGNDCSDEYVKNQQLILTATPTDDSNFAGWSGACSGTGNCNITMNQNQNVTALFNLKNKFILTVSNNGAGIGIVIGQGINCGNDCSEEYIDNTTITLSANPTAGSSFAGWGGACSGTGNCNITMTQNQNVTAIFNATPPTLPLATTNYTPITNDPQKAGEITFEKFMMEVYQPLTDKPTGEYAIFSAPAGSNFTLEVLPGFDDVRIPQTTINALSNMAQVQIVSIIPNRVASTEGFQYPVCSAAKIGENNNSLPAFSRIQETLCIPNIKVANVVNLPDGNNIQLRQECQEITMDISTTQNGILKIKQIRKIPTNNCQ